MSLAYRIATTEDWPAIEEFCKSREIICPPPTISMAALAEDEGTIHGVWFGQLGIQLHPLVTSQSRESGLTVNLRHLIRTLEDGLRETIGGGSPVVYYLFMDPDRTKQIRTLLKGGLRMLPPQIAFLGITPLKEEL